jgi:hypothetical protein
MTILVQDTLLDPLGNAIGDAVIRVTAQETKGATPKAAEAFYTTAQDGSYSFNLNEGSYLIEVNVFDEFIAAGSALVDEFTPTPLDLYTLFQYSTPVQAPIVVPEDTVWEDLHDDIRTDIDTLTRANTSQISDGTVLVNETKQLTQNSRIDADMVEEVVTTQSRSTTLTQQTNVYEDVSNNQSIQVVTSGSTETGQISNTTALYEASNGNTSIHKEESLTLPTGAIYTHYDMGNSDINISKAYTLGDSALGEEVTFTAEGITREVAENIGTKVTATRTEELLNEYRDTDNILVTAPKVTLGATVDLNEGIHVASVYETQEALVDKDDVLHTTQEKGILAYTKKAFQRITNTGFLSKFITRADNYQIQNDAQEVLADFDTVNKTLTVNGTLVVNNIEDFKGDAGDTIYEVFQYSSDNGVTDAWHSVWDPDHGDIYRRHAISTNGSLSTWSAGYLLTAKDGADGDTTYVEYRYSDDNVNWDSVFQDGDIWRQERIIVNNVPQGAWSPSARIKGSDGADGEITEIAYQYSTDGFDPWHSNFSTGDHYRRERVEYFYTPADRDAGTEYQASGWSSAAQIVPIKGVNYFDGLNQTVIYLYQRSSSGAPDLPTTVLTYNFSAKNLTGDLAGWSQTVPAGTSTIWVTAATASSITNTDPIAANEWVAPEVLGTSPYQQATVNLYKRDSSVPDAPTAALDYDFSTGTISEVVAGDLAGWTHGSIPSGVNDLYLATASVVSQNLDASIDPSDWGVGVLNTTVFKQETVHIYKRANSLPAAPTASTTYNFTNGTLTGLTGGWATTLPTGTDDVYVAVAVASSSNNTDEITSANWAVGLMGASGTQTVAITLYKDALTSPDLPSNTAVYDFGSKSFTTAPNNGWTQILPVNATGKVWMTVGVATNSALASSDNIPNTEWTAPAVFMEAGLQTSHVTLYRVSETDLTDVHLPTNTVNYSFLTGKLTDTPNNNWSFTPPANISADPMWITTAPVTTLTINDVDSIGSGEWTTPQLLAKSGEHGMQVATITLFKISTNTPTIPTSSMTYNFLTGQLTNTSGINGWSVAQPNNTSEGGKIWAIHTTALAPATQVLETLLVEDWSAPTTMVVNGTNGIAGAQGIQGMAGNHGKGSYIVELANSSYIPANNSGNPSKDNDILQLAGRSAQNGDVITYQSVAGASEDDKFRSSFLRKAGVWETFASVINGNQIIHGTVVAEHIQAGTITGDLFDADIVVAGHIEAKSLTFVTGDIPEEVDNTKANEYADGKTQEAINLAYSQFNMYPDAGFNIPFEDGVHIGLPNKTQTLSNTIDYTFRVSAQTWGLNYGGVTGEIYQGSMEGDANLFAEVTSDYISVTEGQRLGFSIYVGAHRCKGTAQIRFYNSSFTDIGATTADDNNDEEKGGGSLSGYKRLFTYGNVPTGARYCKIHLRKYDAKSGEQPSNLFYVKPHFCYLVAGATTAPEWSLGDSGATYNATPESVGADPVGSASAAQSAAILTAQDIVDNMEVPLPSNELVEDHPAFSFGNYPNIKAYTPSGTLYTYADAVAEAKSLGARLPTIKELLNDACIGSGGSGDTLRCWTQSKAGDSKRWTAAGKAEQLSNFPREATSETDTCVARFVMEISYEAVDELPVTQARIDAARVISEAYADGVISTEETRAINDVKQKLYEAKTAAFAAGTQLWSNSVVNGNPAGVGYAHAAKYTFNSPRATQAMLLVDAQDCEGGSSIYVNGTRLPSNMSYSEDGVTNPDNTRYKHLRTIDLVQGDNEVAFAREDGDAYTIYHKEVRTGGAIGVKDNADVTDYADVRIDNTVAEGNAAQDATNKANTAKQEALEEAAEDAQDKADTAKAAAIADVKGDNKWLYLRVDKANAAGTIPVPEDFMGTIDSHSWVPDGEDIVENVGSQYFGNLRTFLYVTTARTIQFTAHHDDGGAVYLDDVKIYEAGYPASTVNISLTLSVGWHTLDLLWVEQGGLDGWWDASPVIGSLVDRLVAPNFDADQAIRAAFIAQANLDTAQTEIYGSPLLQNESYYRALPDPFFEHGTVGYATYAQGAPSSLSSLSGSNFTPVSTGEHGGTALQVVGTRWISSIALYPVNLSKTYKVRLKVRQVVDGEAGKMKVYAGAVTLDKYMNYIVGGAGTHRWCGVAGTEITTAQGWLTFEGYISGVGDLHKNFRAGTAYVRPVFIVNHNGGLGTTEVDEISFTEVTDVDELISLGLETSQGATDKASDARTGAITDAKGDAALANNKQQYADVLSRPRTYVARSQALSQTGGLFSGAGVWDDTGTKLTTTVRSWKVSVYNRKTLAWVGHYQYDTFGSTQAVTDMTTKLDSLGNDHLVIITTFDEPRQNLTTAFKNALIRCGATQANIDIMTSQAWRMYLLIGVAGQGSGTGYEQVAKDATSRGDVDNWLEATVTLDPQGNVISYGAGRYADEALLSAAAVDSRTGNSLVSIGSDGKLSGAGGGQVTVVGIGAETPSNAQAKADAALKAATANTIVGFYNGCELDELSLWKVESLNTAVSSTNAFIGDHAIEMRSSHTNPAGSGSTEVVSIEIPERIALAFTGRRVRVTAYVKQSPTNPSTEFAMVYSTADNGNSGWRNFTPTNTYTPYTFTYDVPSPIAGGTDWLGIWASKTGNNEGILVDAVSIELVSDITDVGADPAGSAATARTGAINDAKQDSALANSWITISSDGTLSGGGGGKVTVAGIGADVAGSAATARTGAINDAKQDSALANDQQKYLDIADRPITFSARSQGQSQTAGILSGAGVWNDTGTKLTSTGRSWKVSVYNRNTLTWEGHYQYDTYVSDQAVTDMANKLNSLGNHQLVIVTTFDEPRNKNTTALRDALVKCGATHSNISKAFEESHRMYLLIGIGNQGSGAGYEQVAIDSTTRADVDNWLEASVTLDRSGNVLSYGGGRYTDAALITSAASDSRVSNTSITIGADGKLYGAGGGQVTVGGIGAETPNNAQIKADNALKYAASQHNLIVDAGLENDFTDGLPTGFPTKGSVITSYTVGHRDASDSWGLNYSGNTGVISQGAPQGTNMSLHAEIKSYAIPVIEGQRIGFSVYTGAHRCNTSAFIYFYDINGTVISSSTAGHNDSEKGGGSYLSGYKRLVSYADAPANTISAKAIIRKFNTEQGETSSFLFYVLPQLSVWADDQTEAPTWVQGGVRLNALMVGADALGAAASALADAKEYVDQENFVKTTTYDSDIATIQNQIDGAITTWFYGVPPTVNNAPANTWTTTALKNVHVGDLYYDNNTGFAYRYMVSGGVYSWTKIIDSDLVLALDTAEKAKDTADSKRRVYVSTPTTPYDIGDLWDTGSGIKRSSKNRADGAAYIAGDWSFIADAAGAADQARLDALAEMEGINLVPSEFAMFNANNPPPLSLHGTGTHLLSSSTGYPALLLKSTGGEKYAFLGRRNTDYNIKIIPNSKLIVSMKVKCTNTNPTVSIYLRSSNAGTFYLKTFNVPVNTWTRVSHVFDLTNDASPMVIMRVDKDGVGDCYFTEFMLEHQVEGATTPSAYKAGTDSAFLTALSAQSIAGTNGQKIQIQSDTFDSGTSGWAIDTDGNAEFNEVIVRGDIHAKTLTFDTIPASIDNDLAVSQATQYPNLLNNADSFTKDRGLTGWLANSSLTALWIDHVNYPYNGRPVLQIDSRNDTGSGGAYQPTYRLEPNTEYVYSGLLENGGGDWLDYPNWDNQPLHIQVWTEENPTLIHQEIDLDREMTLPADLQYHFIWRKFKTPASDYQVYFRPFIYNTTGRVVRVAGLKLEKRTTNPTEWIPALVDTNWTALNAQTVGYSGDIQISSSNYTAGSAGWAIDSAGNCEFESGTFRGTIFANNLVGDVTDKITFDLNRTDYGEENATSSIPRNTWNSVCSFELFDHGFERNIAIADLRLETSFCDFDVRLRAFRRNLITGELLESPHEVWRLGKSTQGCDYSTNGGEFSYKNTLAASSIATHHLTNILGTLPSWDNPDYKTVVHLQLKRTQDGGTNKLFIQDQRLNITVTKANTVGEYSQWQR